MSLGEGGVGEKGHLGTPGAGDLGGLDGAGGGLLPQERARGVQRSPHAVGPSRGQTLQ